MYEELIPCTITRHSSHRIDKQEKFQNCRGFKSLKEVRLLDTGSLSAAENMALDMIILEEVAAGNSPMTFRFLQFKPDAALVGYNQDVELEIRRDFCRAYGIDINRRITGGGGILFQESGLGWELFGQTGFDPFKGSFESILLRICSIAADGISKLGVDARFRPRNDIEIDGRKISGTGGVAISGAMMFQGTILIENEVDQFLRALRVPVEKLKKREIESLMDRICFLNDLISPPPTLLELKKAITGSFKTGLGMDFIEAGLTSGESERLAAELEYYQSDEWVYSKSRPLHESEPARSIKQTTGGTFRTHIWLAPGGKRIQQALIVGDFFSIPARLSRDLEASLVGLKPEAQTIYEAVTNFFEIYDGHVPEVEPAEIAEAIAEAARRLEIVNGQMSLVDVNELFFVNLRPEEMDRRLPRWLLLPYCSKNLDCAYRDIPGCSECGKCEIGACYDLARKYGLEPLTVQSFEHLVETIESKCAGTKGIYVGSCCEAFFAKHQAEMTQINASGILVNLDSTTCYDLGKGSQAYKGRFDNKTFLNMDLIEKTLRRLNEARNDKM